MSLLEEAAFALEEGYAAVAVIADCTSWWLACRSLFEPGWRRARVKMSRCLLLGLISIFLLPIAS